MEPQSSGKKSIPDFDSLNGRIIAEPSLEPRLVIKTNLDTKDPTEENPYFQTNHADKENSPIGKPSGEDRGVVALILYS